MLRVEVPSTLRTGRWVPPRRSIIGLLAVALLVALILGGRVAWAVSRDAETASTSGGDATGSSSAAPSASASDGVRPGNGGGRATPGPSSSPGTGAVGVVVVHVVGAVARPGLVELAGGSRVADAVAAAGGATSEADLSAINVARLVVDGEQIRVPVPGEVITSGGSAGGPSAGGGAGGGTGSGGSAGRTISLNVADLSALDSLPGVGPVLAQRILDWRSTHGRFTSVDELGEVSGIGEKLLSQLKPLVTL